MKNFRPSITLAICALGGLLLVIGLFRPGPDAAAQPAPAAAVCTDSAPSGQLDIVDFAFSGTLTVNTCQRVTVVNFDGAPHTATANDASFDSGNLTRNESSVITAPATPGSYAFFCEVHPSMTSTLVVQ